MKSTIVEKKAEVMNTVSSFMWQEGEKMKERKERK